MPVDETPQHPVAGSVTPELIHRSVSDSSCSDEADQHRQLVIEEFEQPVPQHSKQHDTGEWHRLDMIMKKWFAKLYRSLLNTCSYGHSTHPDQCSCLVLNVLFCWLS